MSDYFTRSSAPSAAATRDLAPPTSYVTPTVQPSNQKPGQSVKPSPRQPVGQRSGQSLSRTFSLASADLLRSTGPNALREVHGSPSPSEVVPRRQGGGAGVRERPLSARLSSSTSQHADGCFLNTPPHSSSFGGQTERSADRGRTPVAQNGPSSSSPYHHRGEVAMVTPVRAAPLAQEQGEGLREGRPHLKKDSEGTRCVSAERPPSTPASPDPNNDPQTVWYEYGCV